MTSLTYGDSEAGFAALQQARESKDEGRKHQLVTEYAGMVAGVRKVFESGRTKDIAWRRRQLESLMKGIQENVAEISAAIDADLGGPKIRAMFDMSPIIGDIEYALANLTAWTTPSKHGPDIPIDIQSSFYVRPEPKGVILNIAPWNFPFNLTFQPLVGALAAGNCMVLKPSELSMNSAPLIERIVMDYLDPDCVKVVQGAVAETSALLEQRWDHIFYTGNGVVGRIVMQAAAKHLTPMTLELGGKSPVLVDKTANMSAVVNRIFAAKSLNQGQICIAPDFVIIDETRKKEFLDQISAQVHSSNFGNGSKSNPNWGKVITASHAERLKRLIATSGGTVVCGGVEDVDVNAHHVPMTVITDVDPSAPIMHEEIFGPVLPVVSVKNMDDGLAMIKERERPLAFYVFSQDKAFQERALSEVSSGGAAVNTAVEQISNKQTPFGGTGASGFGRYHGKFGFDEFSHQRTVMYKWGSNPILPPVEKQPAWLADVAMKATVTGFVSPEKKQIMKKVGVGALAVLAALAARSRL
jgi:aldehyde dehydrogenase (NAD+)